MSKTPIPRPEPALEAPPPDVRRLLAQHDAALPLYFDGQRARSLEQSQTAWPSLWRLAPPELFA